MLQRTGETKLVWDLFAVLLRDCAAGEETVGFCGLGVEEKKDKTATAEVSSYRALGAVSNVTVPWLLETSLAVEPPLRVEPALSAELLPAVEPLASQVDVQEGRKGGHVVLLSSPLETAGNTEIKMLEIREKAAKSLLS